MNSIILCEGETDQIVLSEYFCHMYGFKFLRGAKNKPFGNAECRYTRGADQLDIVYVSGNDFSEYVQKVLKINQLNTGNTYTHMAVISDHDSDEEIQQRWQGIIEHESGNSFLAQESKRFVAELIKKKGSLSDDEWNPAFLKSRRMQVKAPLGVFFGVAWPDRAFNDAREMFKRIPWQKYRQIQTSFQAFDIFRQK